MIEVCRGRRTSRVNWKPRPCPTHSGFFSGSRFVAPITRRTWPARLWRVVRELHVTAVNRHSAQNPAQGQRAMETYRQLLRFDVTESRLFLFRWQNLFGSS